MSEGNPIFLDTNIWLYSCLQSDKTINKKQIADSFINQDSVVVSTQVINEVCVNLIKKASLEEVEIKELVKDFYNRCFVIQLNANILYKASDLRQRYCLSYWDSLIVACGLEAGVDTLYSEDMQDGLVVWESLTIVNPFKV
jgi:predicted nucleic acid-binding protein